MNRDDFRSRASLKRLFASIAGGLVLGLMFGKQEGTLNDFGLSFHEAMIKNARGLVFVAIGIGIYFVVTFWPILARYIRRPGAAGLGAAFLLVLVALLLMNWYDPVGKFGDLSDKVSQTSGLDFLPANFFGWLAWALWLACLGLGVIAIVARTAILGYALAVLGVLSAVAAYVAHDQLVAFAGGIDHSLGVYVATVGFLVYAGAGLVIARASTDVANPRAFVERVVSWRPGFPFAVVAAVLMLIAFVNATWFAPQQLNLDFRGVNDSFNGQPLASLSWQYVNWLGPTLTAVAVITALAGTFLRNRILNIATVVLGLVGIIYTFYSLHDISVTGSTVAVQYGKTWQNLGAGGWDVCIGFSLLLIAGLLALNLHRKRLDAPGSPVDKLPFHSAVDAGGRSSLGKALIPAAIALALFYPPTMTGDWQTTIVTQIGPYLLLAVGLNVVVGWAGLLDLGYIAFYGIGSYTTAYFTGSLPVKPPSWLSFFHSPLWAIPFAIIACLIAGVLLGAPTLRLRGDYLAIVTLGFGEIIQIVAINNPGGFTGGAAGPNVPNPVFKIGGLSVHWGLDPLPYWYLLLFFLAVMVVLFYRLEGSRLGRAWAAIREDEVAAQATGIDTTRVKLLAFAIGASTSGLAGVFFATQVGYFDPSLFTLQNSILIVAYVVFGGMGSLAGALAGAAVLTWLPQFLKAEVPLQDRQMWIGALVLAMMIFRPAGLIPARRRKAELEGLEAPASSEVHAVPASEGL